MKRMFFLIILTFLMFFNSNQIVLPQEKETANQPLQEVFQTELVYPQEKGEIQLSIASMWIKNNACNMTQIPFFLEYGLTNSWQIEFEWNSFGYVNPRKGNNYSGIGDLEIATKYSFMNISNSGFHTALGLETAIPVGDENRGLGDESFEVEPYLVFAIDFLSFNRSQLFTQFGMSFPIKKEVEHNTPEEEKYEFNWNIGFFIPINQLCLVAEMNWLEGKDEMDLYGTTGVVWNLPGAYELGLGLAFGLDNTSDDMRVLALFTYEFNLFENDDD